MAACFGAERTAAMDAGLAALLAGFAALDAGLAALLAGFVALDAGLAALLAGFVALDAGLAALLAGFAALDAGFAALLAGLAALLAEARLAAGRAAAPAAGFDRADPAFAFDDGDAFLARVIAVLAADFDGIAALADIAFQGVLPAAEEARRLVPAEAFDPFAALMAERLLVMIFMVSIRV